MRKRIDQIAAICNRYMDGDEENYQIVRYGISLLAENVGKLFFMLLVAVLSGKVLETVLIFGGFCILRWQAGGIHFHTSLGCSAGMLAVWGISLAVSRFVLPLWLIAVMMTFSLVTVAVLAPASTDMNPITETRIRVRKKCLAIIICGSLTVLELICRREGKENLLLMPMVLESASMWALKLQKKKI